MTKYSFFVIIAALFIGNKPVQATTVITPFASTTTAKHFFSTQFITVNAAIENNRVFIDWSVAENETASHFEIEKSNDGKNFTAAGLVFGTDKPATANYRFFEKAVNQKIYYRIKLINKNQKTEYSTVLEVNPKG
jgi:hypothetical protein